jgi:hypothetical protein
MAQGIIMFGMGKKLECATEMAMLRYQYPIKPKQGEREEEMKKAEIEILKLSAVENFVLNPDEFLIISVDGFLNEPSVERIKKTLSEKLKINTERVLLLEGGLKLGKLKIIT